MKERTCKHCRFWDRKEPFHEYADCKRFPPVADFSATGRRESGDGIRITIFRRGHPEFPNIHKDDWCGEYQHREGSS